MVRGWRKLCRGDPALVSPRAWEHPSSQKEQDSTPLEGLSPCTDWTDHQASSPRMPMLLHHVKSMYDPGSYSVKSAPPSRAALPSPPPPQGTQGYPALPLAQHPEPPCSPSGTATRATLLSLQHSTRGCPALHLMLAVGPPLSYTVSMSLPLPRPPERVL